MPCRVGRHATADPVRLFQVVMALLSSAQLVRLVHQVGEACLGAVGREAKRA